MPTVVTGGRCFLWAARTTAAAMAAGGIPFCSSRSITATLRAMRPAYKSSPEPLFWRAGGKAGLYIPQPRRRRVIPKGASSLRGAGQAFHRRLGGRVKALEWNGKHRCGGGNIENTPPTLSQGRQGRLNHRDPCKKIQIKLAAHFCLPGALHRAEIPNPALFTSRSTRSTAAKAACT